MNFGDVRPSPLKVTQGCWGKPGPWRQLLWMELSIREGRINHPAFTYLSVYLFINRANGLQMLFVPSVKKNCWFVYLFINRANRFQTLFAPGVNKFAGLFIY